VRQCSATVSITIAVLQRKMVELAAGTTWG